MRVPSLVELLAVHHAVLLELGAAPPVDIAVRSMNSVVGIIAVLLVVPVALGTSVDLIRT